MCQAPHWMFWKNSVSKIKNFCSPAAVTLVWEDVVFDRYTTPGTQQVLTAAQLPLCTGGGGQLGHERERTVCPVESGAEQRSAQEHRAQPRQGHPRHQR